jgi:hypothetical protein
MVSKCANPECDAHLKYLHEGSLFIVRKPSRRREMPEDEAFSGRTGNQIECFWLCESCSPQMRISGRGELVIQEPLPSAGIEIQNRGDFRHSEHQRERCIM